MQTFQKWLIVLGAFAFAYNAANLAHEAGHAVNVLATGGEVIGITMSPLSWSYTSHTRVAEPMAVAWGGFLWRTVLPLLLALALWCLKSRLSFWAMLLGLVGVAGAAIYMLVGALVPIGDPDELIQLGMAPEALIVISLALMLPALMLVLPIGTLLGIGRGHCSLWKTLLIFCSPILVYLLAVLGYNLVSDPFGWMMWAGTVAVGITLLPVAGVVIHVSAGWVAGDESRRRAAPINWLSAALSVLLGAGIIAFELLLLS